MAPPEPGDEMETRKEISAGGVVYRRPYGVLQVVLASRRTKRGDLAWGLPKGAPEPDEGMEAAAVREVREETGIEAVVECSLGDIRYFYVWEGVRIEKTVRFYLMRAVGGDLSRHDHEMEDVRWFKIADALRQATYPTEREVLTRAADRLG